MAFKLHFLTLLMLICKLWAWIRYNVNWLLDDGDDDALMKPVFTSCKCDRSSDTSRWRWHEDCGEFCINISHPLLCFNSICPLHSQPCAQLTNQRSVFNHVISNWPITIKQSVCQNCLSTFQLSNNGDKIDVENCISESEANSVLFLSPLVDICQWFPIICLKYEG